MQVRGGGFQRCHAPSPSRPPAAGPVAGPVAPCGACRQVLAEFGARMRVLLAGRGDEVVATTLDRLLPDPFTFGALPAD